MSALEFWEAPATGPADIRLTFFQGDHNDGLANAFDGPGAATKSLSARQEGPLARRGSLGVGSAVSILLEAMAKPGSPPKDPPSPHLKNGNNRLCPKCTGWLKGQPDKVWCGKHFW